MNSRWLPAALLALGLSPTVSAINGRVVEDHTGSPLASAGVRIFKAGAPNVLADLDTDGAGRFEAPGLPVGDYRIEISKPNFLPATLHLRATGAEAPVAPVTVRLVRCGPSTSAPPAPTPKPTITGITVSTTCRPASTPSLQPSARPVCRSA